MLQSFASRALRAASVAASAFALLSCGAGPGSSGPGAARTSTAAAPDFTLKSVDGKTVNLSDFLGKNVVLLDFWSTTCEPCMKEMPHLVELYKQNKGKGFVVLAISLDGPETLAQVSSVVHDKEMIFPVLLDVETVVAAKYNPKRELPFWVLIGKNGSIVKKKAGYTPGDENSLRTDVEAALQ